ncbi:MAG: DinB family protein, partial [Flavobacteriaceae bacterium]
MKTLSSNKWVNRINEITCDFENSFGILSVQELNWKPNYSTWSIAENIDHIIKTNKSYFSIIEKARTKTLNTSYLANFGWIVNLFGLTILKGVD